MFIFYFSTGTSRKHNHETSESITESDFITKYLQLVISLAFLSHINPPPSSVLLLYLTQWHYTWTPIYNIDILQYAPQDNTDIIVFSLGLPSYNT